VNVRGVCHADRSPPARAGRPAGAPDAGQLHCVSGCSGLTALGALLTYYSYTTAGPWIAANVPLMDTYMDRAPFIIPPLFAVAGVAHFTSHRTFCSFYPHQVRRSACRAAQEPPCCHAPARGLSPNVG
jgi:hypothetical protein